MNKLLAVICFILIGAFILSSHSLFSKEKQLTIQGRVECDYPSCKGAKIFLLQGSTEITHVDITSNDFKISRTLEIGSEFQLYYTHPYMPDYPDTTLTYRFVPNIPDKDIIRVDDVVWKGKKVMVLKRP